MLLRAKKRTRGVLNSLLHFARSLRAGGGTRDAVKGSTSLSLHLGARGKALRRRAPEGGTHTLSAVHHFPWKQTNVPRIFTGAVFSVYV